jgi:hypothetical protein
VARDDGKNSCRRLTPNFHVDSANLEVQSAEYNSSSWRCIWHPAHDSEQDSVASCESSPTEASGCFAHVLPSLLRLQSQLMRTTKPDHYYQRPTTRQLCTNCRRRLDILLKSPRSCRSSHSSRDI